MDSDISTVIRKNFIEILEREADPKDTGNA
jgi:hypothetical protein